MSVLKTFVASYSFHGLVATFDQPGRLMAFQRHLLPTVSSCLDNTDRPNALQTTRAWKFIARSRYRVIFLLEPSLSYALSRNERCIFSTKNVRIVFFFVIFYRKISARAEFLFGGYLHASSLSLLPCIRNNQNYCCINRAQIFTYTQTANVFLFARNLRATMVIDKYFSIRNQSRRLFFSASR